MKRRILWTLIALNALLVITLQILGSRPIQALVCQMKHERRVAAIQRSKRVLLPAGRDGVPNICWSQSNSRNGLLRS